MTAFVLREEDLKQIRAAIERAREKPVPQDVLMKHVPANQDTATLTLKDREGVPKIPREPELVILTLGWRLAVTWEEQPVGLCLHMSLSSPAKGRAPTTQTMQMIIEALDIQHFGGRTWLEEFEPEQHAVNLVLLIFPGEEPTATDDTIK